MDSIYMSSSTRDRVFNFFNLSQHGFLSRNSRKGEKPGSRSAEHWMSQRIVRTAAKYYLYHFTTSFIPPTQLLISRHTMRFTVTKSSPVLVPPAISTPTGTLPLSSIDRSLSIHAAVDFISVFSHGEHPGKRIKEAFAKALVPYYPVAGRITELIPGVAVVDCTGEGIWYIEATANCTLEDVNYFEKPLMLTKEEMLPRPPASVNLEHQILMAQITQFTCGAFVVGIWFSHQVFDGQGAAQFLKAVGDMARGLPEPTVKPVWSREAIPDPPKVPVSGPPPSLTVYNFANSVTFDISPDSINRIKDKFTAETAKKCSTFDVTTAMIFKSRAKAIKLADTAEVRIMFAASTHHLLHGVVPSLDGYYGNCVYPIGITKTSEEMNNASLVEVIIMIKDAKAALSTKFVDWMNGVPDTHYNVMDVGYSMVCVSDWSWVGFSEVDYGWGQPKYVFNWFDDVKIFGTVIYLNPPKPKRGIRLILQCVKEEHSAEFCDSLLKLIHQNIAEIV